MAKISQFPAAGPLLGDEALPIVQGNESRRVTLDRFRDLLDKSEGARERIRARAFVYGIANPAEARLFAAEATELSFADEVYRHGYAQAPSFAALPGAEIYGAPPITGRGVRLSDAATIGIGRPVSGDVTVMVEIDMPAFNGDAVTLASFVGDMIESRVAIYRSDTATYALQLQHPVQGLTFVPGPQDYAARRMRVAFCIGQKMTRVSFDGGPVTTLVADRPPSLLRLWLGRLAFGYIPALDGYCVRAMIYSRSVGDALLREIAGGEIVDDEVAMLVDQKIASHDHDQDGHDLALLRQQADLTESKTGLWTVRAADTFTRSDGPLGKTEIGGMTWSQNLAVRGNRIREPNGGFAGAFFDTGYADGQLEADLYPASGEASLYFRLDGGSRYWLLQRTPDGGLALYIAFDADPVPVGQPYAVPVRDGDRFKVRLVGARIWVFHIFGGVETLVYDITDTRCLTYTSVGVRLNGGGSADNIRFLSREAI
ncbi:hypothetical protein [uncultured Sphingomonas sp.]|uniref:hypothetical protein n=1 Tax=uncultured Sphingomonas sp. TaxID=158754 RepID=UPI0025D3B568|nr:hypothetical protein [uncultured Sphingomonas sp.]